MTITYASKPGKYAREYDATVGTLHINLEKTNPEYLGWCIWIERSTADGDLRINEYHGYSQTLAEAKQLAEQFVVSYELLATVPVTEHVVGVVRVYNNHGYPFRAACACGWQSNTYAATHAAQIMADDHVASENSYHGRYAAALNREP